MFAPTPCGANDLLKKQIFLLHFLAALKKYTHWKHFKRALRWWVTIFNLSILWPIFGWFKMRLFPILFNNAVSMSQVIGHDLSCTPVKIFEDNQWKRRFIDKKNSFPFSRREITSAVMCYWCLRKSVSMLAMRISKAFYESTEHNL